MLCCKASVFSNSNSFAILLSSSAFNKKVSGILPRLNFGLDVLVISSTSSLGFSVRLTLMENVVWHFTMLIQQVAKSELLDH